jgi:hypothetical protein
LGTSAKHLPTRDGCGITPAVAGSIVPRARKAILGRIRANPAYYLEDSRAFHTTGGPIALNAARQKAPVLRVPGGN